MKQPVHIFKALADETRLRILALLLTEQELCVCDIIASLRLSQSTVSRHLAYLRKSGLVNDRRCGLWMYYSIVDSEGAFQRELIEFLKANLAALPDTAADRNCLESFGKSRSCD
ncbi:MAG: metalloregulator ArsR/SmtB family transcription factor [Steroidobacteraceae bacterium]|nr:metalloregulator ArsR/SmtB family transcription factor [Deltaproteobacteria bacterium]